MAAPQPASFSSTTAPRWQIGPYWLWYHAKRSDWCICWYDPAHRTNRRVSTGIRGGTPEAPPLEAQRALFSRAGSMPADKSASPSPCLLPLLQRWLEEHASGLARADAYHISVRHFDRFVRTRGSYRTGVVPLAAVDRGFIKEFTDFRYADGVVGETIRGDLAALRSALTWAEREGLIEKAPRVPELPAAERSPPRDLEYSVEEVAALLEAAWRLPERRHVHLFTMIMLSTHARVEAVLELHSSQIKDGRIHFNAPGRVQTSKRRPIVPIPPSLAPWLKDMDGKVIQYRAARKQTAGAWCAEPEYYTRDCLDIGRAFEACLLEAGLSQLGKPRFRSALEISGAAVSSGRGLGTPNTLRHTIHTYLQTQGVPQAQIDAAAGHRTEIGSGRNYTHLRPEYLREFVSAIEAYWIQLDHYTSVHRRS